MTILITPAWRARYRQGASASATSSAVRVKVGDSALAEPSNAEAARQARKKREG